MVFYTIASHMYFRSPAHAKPVKLITLFLRTQHLSAKAFDLIHELRLSLCQKWVLRQMTSLSEQSEVRLLRDVDENKFIANLDNVKIATRVQSQRLDNQDQFDSGCLVTIYIVKQPDVVPPSMLELYQQRSWGRSHPISHLDLLKLDTKASAALKPRLIHTALQVLLDAHNFDLKSYTNHAHPALAKPASIRQLPTGKLHRNIQHIMPCQYPEVATYKGNNCIAQWVLSELVLHVSPFTAAALNPIRVNHSHY
jgi:hypothetical protein